MTSTNSPLILSQIPIDSTSGLRRGRRARRSKRLAKRRLRLHQLPLGHDACALALVGDTQAVFDRRDQRLVRLLHALDVKDATLDLRARLDVGRLQRLGIASEGLVR